MTNNTTQFKQGEKLRNLGFDEREITVYLTLLENGPMLPQYIARRSGIKRTTLYEVFPMLLQKGAIEEIQQGKRRLFQAISPDKLLDEFEEKQKEIREYLGELASIFRIQGLKPKIEVYEGVEGIKKVYMDTLTAKRVIKSYDRVSQYHPQVLDWINSYYVPQRVKKGILAQSIVTANEAAKKHMPVNAEELRETRFVPEEKFPFKIDGMIYCDKICFTTVDRNSPLVGIIIESKQISQTHKALFDLAWEGAEKYQ